MTQNVKIHIKFYLNIIHSQNSNKILFYFDTKSQGTDDRIEENFQIFNGKRF